MKKIVAFFMSLIMIVSMISFTGTKAEAASKSVVEGTAYYASEFDMRNDYTAAFYYKDGYFAGSSYKENRSLATMSMILAMAAGRSNRTSDYSKKTQNIKKLWEDCGFSNIYFNKNYKRKPASDDVSCGFARAKKPDATLRSAQFNNSGYWRRFYRNNAF